MSRILVIGARGAVGRAVVASLRRNDKLQVETAGRRPGVDAIACDLNDPATFPALNQADVIINCADNFQASPLPLMQYCLEQGLTLLDCTADPRTIEVAMDRFKTAVSSRGRVVLGAGLFPGISNILAHDAMLRCGTAVEFQLTIFVSPFSQAGESTCQLMAEHFGYPTKVMQDGVLREVPTLQWKPQGLRLYFPEVIMFSGKGLRRLETFLVPMPRILVPLLALMRPVFSIPGMQRFSAFGLRVLRSRFLRNKNSHIRLHGRALGVDGKTATFQLETRDGFGSIASGVHVLLERTLAHPARTGLLMPNDVVPTWEVVRGHYQRLSPDDRVQTREEMPQLR